MATAGSGHSLVGDFLRRFENHSRAKRVKRAKNLLAIEWGVWYRSRMLMDCNRPKPVLEISRNLTFKIDEAVIQMNINC